MSDHAAQVEAFRQRVFSGSDVLMLMDIIGVGVGFTIDEVRMYEMRLAQFAVRYRKFDFDLELTVDEVKTKLELFKRDRGLVRTALSRAGRREET